MVSHDKRMQNISAGVQPIPCKETQSGSPGALTDCASLPFSKREKLVESFDGGTKGEMVGIHINVSNVMVLMLQWN